MIQLSNEEITNLKKKELNLLSLIKDVCKKNGLRYTALHGTLLGAVRHKGFIPWDDDIDIGMPRKDYDYLIDHFDELFPDNIGLITPQTSKHYEVFFAKIHDKNTTYIELGMSKRPDRYSGVFIDVFPMDGAPEDEIGKRKFKRKYQWLMFCNYKIRFGISDVHTFRAKLLHLLFLPLRIILPYDYYYKKYLKLIYENDYDKSDYMTYPTVIYGYDYIFNKEKAGTIIIGPFENTEINILSGYDYFLTHGYGDYMKLPPEEKRVSHHYADYISFDLPFKEFDLKNIEN